MKNKKIISLILAVAMLATLFCQPALAIAEDSKRLTKSLASDIAPENYKPQNTFLEQSLITLAAETEKKVLLIED